MKDICDIEDIVSIKELSLYIDIAVLVVFLFAVVFSYRLYQKRKNKKPTKEELALIAYKEIDLSNPKRASYLMTKYGYILAKDEKSKDIFKELTKELSRYKYKKTVEPFDDKTLDLYHLFLEVVTNE